MNWLCVFGHHCGCRHQPVDAHTLLRSGILKAIRKYDPDWMPRGASDFDLEHKVEAMGAQLHADR